MRKIKRFAHNFLKCIEYILFYKKFETFLKKPKLTLKEKLISDHLNAFKELENFTKNEIFKNYKFDKGFFYDLTLKTQTVIKKNKLSFVHGFLLQFFLSKYIEENYSDFKQINILEIGTARGYSSLCMSKTLKNQNIKGKIYTIDILPINKKIYWGSISDFEEKKNRNELLLKWKDLLDEYIIFLKGYTNSILKIIEIPRINFAFVDGSHEYEDVIQEINYIKKRQVKNDIIFFDDYNETDYPGVIKAVNELKKEDNYHIEIFDFNLKRKYVLAKKK